MSTNERNIIRQRKINNAIMDNAFHVADAELEILKDALFKANEELGKTSDSGRIIILKQDLEKMRERFNLLTNLTFYLSKTKGTWSSWRS